MDNIDGERIRQQASSIWDNYWQAIIKSGFTRDMSSDPYARLVRRLYDASTITKIKLLEVGCGSGFLTYSLILFRKEKRFDSVLLDYSGAALELSRQNSAAVKSDIKFVGANALQMPFSDNEFDVVFNEGLNEHFDGNDRQKIFDEMARVCRTGGQVIVTVPNAVNMFYRIEKWILERRNSWPFGYEKGYTIFELRRKMKKAGLKICKYGGANVVSQLISIINVLFLSGKKKTQLNSGNAFLEYSALVRLKRTLESILERSLWFYARDIGIMGIKIY
jgi:SAM-dependent methyltransferase